MTAQWHDFTPRPRGSWRGEWTSYSRLHSRLSPPGLSCLHSLGPSAPSDLCQRNPIRCFGSCRSLGDFWGASLPQTWAWIFKQTSEDPLCRDGNVYSLIYAKMRKDKRCLVENPQVNGWNIFLSTTKTIVAKLGWWNLNVSSICTSAFQY